MEKYWRKDCGGEVVSGIRPSVLLIGAYLNYAPTLPQRLGGSGKIFLDGYISKGWFPGPRKRKTLLGCKMD